MPTSVKGAAAWSGRFLLVVGALAVIGYLMLVFKVILVPVAIALLLTVLLMPVKRFLVRRLHLGDGLASGVTLVLLIVVVLGLVVAAGGSIVSGFAELKDKAIGGYDQAVTWLREGPLQLDSSDLQSWLDKIGGTVSSNSSTWVSGALGAATTVGHVLAGSLIALFCTFFFLHDGRRIWAWIVGLFPTRQRDRVHQAGRRGLVTLAGYARTQVLVAFVDGFFIGLGAAVFGVPLAVPLGILVFVGSFVPIVGAVLTGTVAVLVALVAKGWVTALIMLGVVLLVQQLEGHVLQPFLMGHAVSLHPVAVLLSVAAASFVAGIVGALFAVPLVAVVNTVVLYLHGHDKFPELGTDDHLRIRGRTTDDDAAGDGRGRRVGVVTEGVERGLTADDRAEEEAYDATHPAPSGTGTDDDAGAGGGATGRTPGTGA